MKATRFLIRFIDHTSFTDFDPVQDPLVFIIRSFLILKITVFIVLIHYVDRETEDAQTGYDEDTKQGIQKKEALI